jgi:trehalose/maltose hydrolase-like predicted phosphorylase
VRPSGPADKRFASLYLFAACRPGTDQAWALALPEATTRTMNIFLASFATQLDPGTHAVLILDQAGWHGGNRLVLPEEFPGAMAEVNFRHYEPRCAHGSSLSAGFHALVAARLGDGDTALRYLREAAALDLDPDPSSAGGVRMAGLGGVWQAVVFGFAGLDLTGDMLGIDPKLPPQWRSLSFRACWQGRTIQIDIAGGVARATLAAGEAMDLRVAGRAHKLMSDATLEVSP